MKNQIFSLHYPWDVNGYKPDVQFTLRVSDTAFHLHIKTMESNPLRQELTPLQFVHYDSCVEWFVNFAPDFCDQYFNFEINANGTLYAAFRKNRAEFQLLDLEDLNVLKIIPHIVADYWTIDFEVPFTFIQKYIPEYTIQKHTTIRSNFYKCGDHTANPHFGIWNPIDLPKPDFHRPEFFGEISII